MSFSNKIIGDAALLMICMLIVNAGNYGINLVLGRFLGPSLFAEANILATCVLVLSFVALGFQLTITKFVAQFYAENDIESAERLLSWFQKIAVKLYFVLIPILFLSVPSVTSFMQLSSTTPLYIMCLGVPMYLHMSISRGYFQGTEQFRKLGITYIIEMLARLAFTFGLLWVSQTIDYSGIIIAIGFLASFGITFLFSYIKTNEKALRINPALYAQIKFFVVTIALYELSQICINNSDIILVKHFFTDEKAGLYGSLALIGKIVFFATWTLVSMLLPKVIEYKQKGLNHEQLLLAAIGVVCTIGGSLTLGAYFFDSFILNILFGGDFLSVAPLLWKYTIASSLFACANVFAYYYMSLDKYLPVWFSLIAGFIQIGAITLFHQSLDQVIYAQIIVMSVLIISMVSFHLRMRRTSVNTIDNAVLETLLLS